MSTPTTTTALAAAPPAPLLHDPQTWGPMLELPCDLTLDLLVPEFTVAHLLRLQPGDVLETHWPNGEDVPLRINEQFVAWAEFEVVGNRLAVRVTEWA